MSNSFIRNVLASRQKVEDWKGEVLSEVKIDEVELSGDRIMQEDVTYIINHIMLDNGARAGAFGSGSFLVVSGHPEVSVKTGTTNDRRDNWTVGYSKHALVVAWVGNNDNSPMSGAVSGVSGASPIWNRIIKETLDRAEDGKYNHENLEHAWPLQPDTVVGASVCTDNGNVAGQNPENPSETNCPTRFEYFLKGNVGSNVQAGAMDVSIDKTVQTLADLSKPPEKGGTLPENVELQNHPFLIDPLGTLVCLDCAPPQWNQFIGYPLAGQ